ncbi:hypothetical protein VNO78_05613 [Psophocarpus tetragonolobus]|uniref:RRM domain-containing protein n=1 Tax=Psophocarpus tetragonolobus TaxID=3891 RepID=A0AAN9T003_PSOTE
MQRFPCHFNMTGHAGGQGHAILFGVSWFDPCHTGEMFEQLFSIDEDDGVRLWGFKIKVDPRNDGEEWLPLNGLLNKEHDKNEDSSRPPEAASPAGTGEPPGGPDPAAPHDRRSRLERTPRSRRRSRLARQIAAAIASSTPKSRRRSRLARPDRGGDRASRPNRGGDRVSAARSSGSSPRTGPRTRSKRRFTAAFSAVQIPSEILASVPRSARSSGSSPRCLEPPRSRRILASALGAAPRTPAALRRVSNPDQIPSEVAFSAPPRPPAPAALRRAVSNRPDHDLDRVSAAQLAADLGFSAPLAMLSEDNSCMVYNVWRNAHPNWLIKGFHSVVLDSRITYIPLMGPHFMWTKSKGTPNVVAEKLDRALATQQWLDQFPHCYLLNGDGSKINVWNDPWLHAKDPYVPSDKIEGLEELKTNIKDIVNNVDSQNDCLFTILKQLGSEAQITVIATLWSIWRWGIKIVEREHRVSQRGLWPIREFASTICRPIRETLTCAFDVDAIICVWCWHHIMNMAEKDYIKGRCPACRSPYDKEKIVGMAANCERLLNEINMEKKMKTQKVKFKSSDGRKKLSSVRVIQRNLVYIVGLPLNLADEDLLKRREYFSQYGKVVKVAMSRTAAGVIQQFPNDTCSVYVYSLKASLTPCSNPDCLYLHEIGPQEDSFTKDEIISAYTRFLSSSDLMTLVLLWFTAISRAQISAPPGFSIPSRLPPPGFSSHVRVEQAFDSISGNSLFDHSLLRNSYQTPPARNLGSAGDIEFVDPAILAVGKRRLQGSLNSPALDMRSVFTPQSNYFGNDARLQLLMQRSLSPQQNLRFTEIGNTYSQLGDSSYAVSSRFDQSLVSNGDPFQRLSRQQSANGVLSNGVWDRWNELQDGNSLGVAELLRNERLGFNKFYSEYDDSKFRMPNSGNLYNRTFRM